MRVSKLTQKGVIAEQLPTWRKLTLAFLLKQIGDTITPLINVKHFYLLPCITVAFLRTDHDFFNVVTTPFVVKISLFCTVHMQSLTICCIISSDGDGDPGLQIRVCTRKLFFLFLNRLICC